MRLQNLDPQGVKVQNLENRALGVTVPGSGTAMPGAIMPYSKS
jgi:hypothetical protein